MEWSGQCSGKRTSNDGRPDGVGVGDGVGSAALSPSRAVVGLTRDVDARVGRVSGTRAGRRRGLVSLAFVVDGLCELEKGLLDALVVLGARLEVENVVFGGEPLRHVARYDALVVHVHLVADEHALDVVRRVLLDVAQPLAHVLERLAVGHVEHEHYAHRAAVV